MPKDRDLVLDGSPGQGVATALVTGGTDAVLKGFNDPNVNGAFDGILNATEHTGINPVGHGQITAAEVHDSDRPTAATLGASDYIFG